MKEPYEVIAGDDPLAIDILRALGVDMDQIGVMNFSLHFPADGICTVRMERELRRCEAVSIPVILDRHGIKRSESRKE